MSAYTVPLPPGADPKWSGDWECVDGAPLRTIWSRAFYTTPDTDIRAICTQRGDGAVIVGDPHEQLGVHFGDIGLSAAEARQFAAALLKAADLADQWASRQLRLVQGGA